MQLLETKGPTDSSFEGYKEGPLEGTLNLIPQNNPYVYLI